MDLKLYDTLSRDKRPFVPLDPARVRMYVCGPTVYDFAHIGNARPVIVFDVLFRLLRHLYGADHVIYVRNITDVDDKINARAAEEYPDVPLNDAIKMVTKNTESQFHKDVDALGCLRPTVEPRATEHIAEMRALIERLLASDCAYVEQDHVLFRVTSMPDYGRLARRSIDEMIAGARVEVAPYKRNPMDFVLWKPSKLGEPSWKSPAGIQTPGRPGWHIECSAMSDRWLWTEAKANLSQAGLAHPHQFDIHGGGIDLVFPHHENEIAQSRCAFHTPAMANYWMHNGFLQVEGEKMSKSLGNFVTIRELVTSWNGQAWKGEEIRYVMLSTHYRQPIDWTHQALVEARSVTSEWKRLLASVDPTKVVIGPSGAVVDALADDLDTPAAIQRLHDLAKEARTNHASAETLYGNLVFLGLSEPVRDGVAQIVHDAPSPNVVLDEAEREKAREQVSQKVELFVRSLSTSANVVSVAVSVSSSLPYVFAPGQVPNFLSPWTKYGPPFISAEDMTKIENGTTINRLNSLIEQRLEARKARNFAESDRIRDELAAMGIVLKDSKDGTTWEVKR